jgi:ArsR family metal-binding transcriptional regulator
MIRYFSDQSDRLYEKRGGHVATIYTSHYISDRSVVYGESSKMFLSSIIVKAKFAGDARTVIRKVQEKGRCRRQEVWSYDYNNESSRHEG